RCPAGQSWLLPRRRGGTQAVPDSRARAEFREYASRATLDARRIGLGRHHRHLVGRPHHGRGGPVSHLRVELRQRAEELVALYPRPRSAMLPLLHLAQEQDGYVSVEGIAEV